MTLREGSDNAPRTPRARHTAVALPTRKFSHPELTANGEARAHVTFDGYRTVWFNTGTLCNIACKSCYIESSPRNDRLVYLSASEVARFLDEAELQDPRPTEIGFTGGEPFMNPEFIAMLGDSLARGFRVLVLTNAMKPMQHLKDEFLALSDAHPKQLAARVSIDHYRAEKHEAVRGPRTWQPSIEGLKWLAGSGFDVSVAGRTIWGETDAAMREGFAALFRELDIAIDTHDRGRLVLFPEMDEQADVPEITERCWGILGKSPSEMMCAHSRMVIKRKDAAAASVASCTLLPYAPEFEMGSTLAEAARSVSLNHPHCARFCVLGGASCSATP